MSLEFLEMSIEQFKTFQEPVVLPLTGLGLVLVRGENKVDPAADSNGVGKTALWDALSWILFGETLRGEKADEVACRFTKAPCIGKLKIRRDGELWEIERGRRPTFATLSGEGQHWEDSDVKGRVESILGYGFLTFKNAQIFGQETFDRFARAGQSDQMRMLDEIQGLDFRAALDRAKAWRDDYRRRLDDLDGEAIRLTTGLQEAQAAIQNLQEARGSFQETKKQRVAEATRRQEQGRERLRVLKEDLGKLQEAAAVLPVYQQALAARAKVAAEIETAARTADRLRIGSQTAAGELGRREKAMEALIASGTCPTCRGKLVGKRIEEIREAFAPDIVKARETWLQAEKDAAKAEADTAGLELRLAGLPAPDPAALSQAQNAAALAQSKAREASSAEEELRGAAAAVLAERDAKWDGEQALTEATAAAKSYGEESQKNVGAKLRTRATIAVAEYWVEAFGDRGLRSLLFDSVEGFLNDRVSNHLGILTAGRATAAWSAQQELKKGGFKEKMTLAVEWAYGAASYVGGSSGQDRRIDLAQFNSLQDLAESRSARPFPFKVWDEPGDMLDKRGREIFCAWVAEDVHRRGTGFLITHAEDIEGMLRPDETWTVILEESGARVERSGGRIEGLINEIQEMAAGTGRKRKKK